MATAHMLGLDAPALAQAASMVDFVRSCQVGSCCRCSTVWHAAAACSVRMMQTCLSTSLLTLCVAVAESSSRDQRMQSMRVFWADI